MIGLLMKEAPIVSGIVRFHPCQKPVAVLEKIIATHF
jgi:hypothetical protein